MCEKLNANKASKHIAKIVLKYSRKTRCREYERRVQSPLKPWPHNARELQSYTMCMCVNVCVWAIYIAKLLPQAATETRRACNK